MSEFVFSEVVGELNAFQIEYLREALTRSCLFSGFEVSSGRIEYTLVNESDFSDVDSLIEKLLLICKDLNKNIIFEQHTHTPNTISPMSVLESNKHVIKVAGEAFVYQGLFLQLMIFFERYIFSFSKRVHAIEQNYPVRWPIDIFKKINYFEEFPQNVFLLTGVKKQNASLKSVSSLYSNQKAYDSIDIKAHFDQATAALGTSVCDPCYYALLNAESVNNTMYTAFNKNFRNEITDCHDLERLKEFSMREVIAVGDLDFVLESRDKFIKFAGEILKLTEMDSLIETANDPFFTNDSIMKNVFQSSVNCKYEVLSKLNYADKYLAVGSINWHGNFFGKAFNIKSEQCKFVFSSCIGFGLERLAYVFLSQYGLDKDQWPQQFIAKFDNFFREDSAVLDNLCPEDLGEFQTETRSGNSCQSSSAGVHSDTSGSSVFTRADLQRSLREIFVDVFELSNEIEESKLNVDSLFQWDSMSHLHLLIAIENKFQFKINHDHYVALYNNFDSILLYLEDVL